MKGVLSWLEHSFSPRMSTVASNTWVVVLKDSIMQVLPFIFLGSLFAMLTVVADFVSWWPDFWVPYGWTMGLVGLFVAMLIPFNLMEKLRLRKQRVIAALTGLAVFLLVINPQVVASGEPGFGHELFGAGGMFVAIVVGIFVGVVMKVFGSFSFFKDDSPIPDFVRAWFDSMLPIGLTIVPVWILVGVAGFDLAQAVQTVFSPIAGIMEHPVGFPLVIFLSCFIYSMGISPWVLAPILLPVMYRAMAENVAGTAENLVTYSAVYATYLYIGGIGTTLPLVLMMLRAKSTRLKALGRACLPPGILNINEPVIFGAVAWNPVMMIGMWLQGIILPAVLWIGVKVIPFAPVPMRQFDLWYTPYPLSTWLSTGSLRAVVMALVIFCLAAVIWYPFFTVYDKQVLRQEKEEAVKGPQGGDGHGASRQGAIRRSTKRLPRPAAESTRES